MNDEEAGKIKEKISTLESRMQELEDENKEQRALINRGKGAFWVLTVLGAVVTSLFHMFGGPNG